MKKTARARWLTLLVALACLIFMGIRLARAMDALPAHEMQDVVQERLDLAPPPLLEIGGLSQTFVCNKDGLHAIEVMLIVFDAKNPLPAGGMLSLSLVGDDGSGPILSTMPTAGLQHNQRLRFEFAPQAKSKGVSYRLTLRAADVQGVSYWVTSHEAYAGGSLSAEKWTPPGESDLYFVTYGSYSLSQALGDAWRGLGEWARYLAAALALLVMPGLAIWCWLWPGRWRRTGVSAAMVLGLSMASWPLILLWTSTLGLKLGGAGAWLIGLTWTGLALWGLWCRRRTLGPLPTPRTWLPDLALLAIMVIALATRWWHVRELVVPAWVDSQHHSLICKIIAESGRVPLSLRPYAKLDDFHYHFGFHANAAAFSWLTGMAPWQAVMLVGQWLNALAALATAGLAVAWTRRIGAPGSRWAGAVAALVVALVAFMPAYYVSWGRYTQLAGLVMLPALLIASDDLLHPNLSRRARQGMALVTAILLAGMGVTHYRVLVFVALWAPLAVALAWGRFVDLRVAWGVLGRSLLTLVGATVILLAPWIWRFAMLVIPHVGTNYGGMAGSEGLDTSFPVGLLDVGITRTLIKVAIAGAGWALLRGRWRLALLVPWAGLCFLMANAHVLGLPNLWLVHNSCVFISFWLPVGVLIGWLVADLFRMLVRLLNRTLGSWADPAPILGWLALVAVLWIGGRYAWGMVNVVNPSTEIVTQEDRVAIAWCQDHLPPDALVLVNARKWQGELRCGSDGGWWLPIIADIQVTMPPVLYGQGGPEYVAEVNGLAGMVEDAESLSDPALLDKLHALGVTHVFAGAKGGRLMPKELDESDAYEMLYTHGAARVYAVR